MVAVNAGRNALRMENHLTYYRDNGQKKSTLTCRVLSAYSTSRRKSDSAGYLAGTEAPSTYVDMAGSTFDQSLYTTYIRLPGSIGTTMRVRDLNTKGHALAANIALCHFSCTSFFVSCIADIILPQHRRKCKIFFEIFSII